MIRKIVLLSAFVIAYGTVFSQQQFKEFTQEPKAYFNEMKQLLEATPDEKRKEEAVALLKEFKELWLESGYFSDTKKKNIYRVSNNLLSKKAKSFPHFFTYVQTLVHFSKNSNKEHNYDPWENGLKSLCEVTKNNIKDIENYIEQTYNLISKNTIYESRALEWKANTTDFKIVTVNQNVKVVFEKPFDLVCYSLKDSANIYNTQGVFMLLDNKWVGVNGKVTWERAGLEKDKVFAMLGRYEIDMTKSFYRVDSVQFINTYYLDEPIMGALEDRITGGIGIDVKAIDEMDEKLEKKLEDDRKLNTAEKLYQEKKRQHEQSVTYPRFNSYAKRIQINDIYEYVNYDGGFSMEGGSFIGTGDKNERAMLNFYKDKKVFLSTSSNTYIFKKDWVIGKSTAITFRLDTDSIYHPGLLFKYDVKNKTVELNRNQEGMARSAFYDSYHDLDMSFELMSWKIDEPTIRFQKMKGDNATSNTSLFESNNYYRKFRFDKLQGMDKVHPLAALQDYCETYKTRDFTGLDYANSINVDHADAKQVLMRLSYLGLILYDPESDELHVLDRTYNYMDYAGESKDYDVIQFSSLITSPDSTYGSINLLNWEMNIKGVNEIFLSDSQSVIIWPNEGKIKVKRNRDFEFDGKILAGYFLFNGTNFKFNYDGFKVKLDDVKYARFQVPTGYKLANNQPELKTVTTSIENIRGNLLIDNPFNKSGVKKPKFPQFPILESEKDCYVFYDDPGIFSGVYNRANFFFQIYPFVMDSLNNLTRDGTKFGGRFVSGGIFPVFEDSLRVQPDYSLGFIRSAPPEGFPAYGGKGTYKNDIILNSKGLQGKGQFDYHNATTLSDEITFFPDSMNCNAKSFKNKKQATGVQYPDIEASNCKVHFDAKTDQLYTHSGKTPIKMFEGNTTLTGTTVLSPTGANGKGMLNFEKAQLSSDWFSFKEHEILADTAAFSLKDVSSDDFAFKTDNVNAHIDFKERVGLFKSNGSASFVEFPQNQYICYMDQFKWWMDKEEIEMSAQEGSLPAKDTAGMSPIEIEDLMLEGSEFVSIHPQQDSLRFKAPSANYNLRKHLITAHEVQWIRVADATVYPSDGEVVVEKRAQMQTLKNCKIIANNATKYHTIYNADVNIYGKKSYNGSGDYDYLDENNNKQLIHFDVVSVDSTIQTYATGSIGITDGFTLSPAFAYTGKVRMEAASEFLTFDGSTMISHECPNLERPWIQFKAAINPREIFIPIGDQIKNINNMPVFAGIYESIDSLKIYTAFLSKLKDPKDSPLLRATGFLYFEKTSGKYKISNKEKLIEFNMPGNYLSIHRSVCNAYGEGKIDMGSKLGQVKISSVGSINQEMASDYVKLDLLMGIDFFFADQCLSIMADKINGSSTAEGVDWDRETFRKGMYELLGMEEADKIISDLQLYGEIKKFPKQFEHTIFFTDVQFEWNKELESYVSVGPIGIGNMGRTQINKKLSGKIELEKTKSGDVLTIYLSNGSDWFFFQYRANQMLGLSSSQNFNNVIKELKPEKCQMEVPKGEPPYRFYLATDKKMREFLKKFEEGADDEGTDGGGE